MKKKIKNSQPQTKFTGSYKKRVYKYVYSGSIFSTLYFEIKCKS